MLSVNIPVKIDSKDRLENLIIVLNYLIEYCKDIEINVCENDSSPKHEQLCKNFNINYIFLKNDNDYIEKCRTLNQLCRNSSNDIILNYDVDAIIPYSQIKDAITMIKNGADMVYPYSGLFLNVTRETIQQLIISKFNFSMLNETNTQWWNDKAIGGAMMWNKKSYMDSGMENENFKGWGFEDDERVTRSRILGLTIQRTTGPLYHIDHSRTSPNYNQTQLTQNNQRLLNGIARMNRQQLLEEIKKWKWL